MSISWDVCHGKQESIGVSQLARDFGLKNPEEEPGNLPQAPRLSFVEKERCQSLALDSIFAVRPIELKSELADAQHQG